jgi:hypothetical protein
VVIARFLCLALVAVVGCATEPDPARQTPKSTARTLIQAMADGDKSVVHNCIVKDSDQRKLADGVMALTHGVNHASNSMQKRYGETISRSLGGPIDFAKLRADMIDSGEETITGDSATLVTRAMKLDMQKRSDGWRIDLIKSLGIDDQNVIKYALPWFAALGTAANDVAIEIDAGKYPTFTAAIDALQSRIGDAMAEQGRKIAMRELKSRFLFWP